MHKHEIAHKKDLRWLTRGKQNSLGGVLLLLLLLLLWSQMIKQQPPRARRPYATATPTMIKKEVYDSATSIAKSWQEARHY